MRLTDTRALVGLQHELALARAQIAAIVVGADLLAAAIAHRAFVDVCQDQDEQGFEHEHKM